MKNAGQTPTRSCFSPIVILPLQGRLEALHLLLSLARTRPSDVAKVRAPAGLCGSNKGTGTLSRLISFHRHPVIPVPSGLGAEWTRLWATSGFQCFRRRVPFLKGRRSTILLHVAVVDKVLEEMTNNLKQASALFLEPLSPWYPSLRVYPTW